MLRKQSNNPKNVAARRRVKLSYIPPVALAHCAHALMRGADKYGPYNWRDKDVAVMEYLSAMMRHIADFIDGETHSQDDDCHHLGHAMASAAILLDAIECGKVIDDRPKPGPVPKVFGQIEAKYTGGQSGKVSGHSPNRRHGVARTLV